MSLSDISRRDVLIGVGAAGLGAGVSRLFGPARTASTSTGFRFAHLTDFHIKGRGGVRETQRAIRHAIYRPNPPELIVNGGDLVYDAMASDERAVAHQWRHVTRALRAAEGVPIEHVLGNHDIWGIDREKSQTTGKEALYGKKWAMEVLEMPKSYRSFDKGGWHFVLLDDVVPLPEAKTYEARLDEEQFKWLEADLATVTRDTPVVVFTHVPILGASVFFPPQTSQNSKNWALPFSMMHADAHRFVTLFEKHPNVKLCLSGHTHLVDRVEYKGVAYQCNGAISGNWWNGNFQGFPPGYSIIELHPNGEFKSEFQHYCDEA